MKKYIQTREGAEMVRIDCRADVFELLGQNDWELLDDRCRSAGL